MSVDTGGVYRTVSSVQFTNTSATAYDVDIWLRLNGTDIANSNYKYTIPGSHGGTNGHAGRTFVFYVRLAVGDVLEYMWCTENTAAAMRALAAQTSPTRPVSASATMTMSLASGPSIQSVTA